MNLLSFLPTLFAGLVGKESDAANAWGVQGVNYINTLVGTPLSAVEVQNLVSALVKLLIAGEQVGVTKISKS